MFMVSVDYDVIVVGAGPAGSTAAAEAVREGSGEARVLSRYQSRWEKTLGGKFRAFGALKTYLDNMTAEQVKDFMDMFGEAGIRKLILEGKYASAALRMIVKKPWTLRYAPLAYRVKRHGVF